MSEDSKLVDQLNGKIFVLQAEVEALKAELAEQSGILLISQNRHEAWRDLAKKLRCKLAGEGE